MMTASRAIRGTKAKVLLYVVLVFTFTGLITMFNNVVTKLDEAKSSYVVCHQQQENLSTQLQGKLEECYFMLLIRLESMSSAYFLFLKLWN